MKQKKNKTTAKINYIYNAIPQFVSIVDHGANQTPFTAVKMTHKGEQKMPIPRKDLSTVKKEAKEAIVQRMEFSKTMYKSEADVVAYLTSNNWDGYTIEAVDEAFVVSNGEYAKEAFTDLKKVDVEDGVEAYVGSLAEGAEVKATDNPSILSKVDYYGIWTSSAHTLLGILGDGMEDGIAPGIDTITTAMEKVLSNILVSDQLSKSEKNSAITDLVLEYSSLVIKVSDLYDALLNTTEPSDATKAKLATVKKSITTIRASDEPNEEITDTDVMEDADNSADETPEADAVKQEIETLKQQVAEAVAKAAQVAEELSVIKAIKPTLKSIRVDHVDDSQERKLSKQAEEELAKNAAFLRKCNALS